MELQIEHDRTTVHRGPVGFTKGKSKQPMKYVDLMVFDLDGTLIDSRVDIAKAVNQTLRTLGRNEKSEPEITSYIGKGIEELLKKVLGTEEAPLLEKALAEFEAYFMEHATDTSYLYPGVEATLKHFNTKKKVIVSNRKSASAMLCLSSLGIRAYFNEIIGGDNAECMKPSACPLVSILKRFKIQNEKAIIIGDMDIDIVTGKTAKIVTCAVTYGFGAKDDIVKAEPDYIIDSISDLTTIIA